MIPLTLAKIGEENLIKKISGNMTIRQHLENLGFVIGSSITLINEYHGNIIVNIKNSRIGISEEMARKIMI